MSLGSAISSIISFIVILLICMLGELLFGPIIDAFANIAATISYTGITPDFYSTSIEAFPWFHSGIRIFIIAALIWVFLRIIMSAYYTRQVKY